MSATSAAAGAAPARPGITIPFDGIPLHAHREWFARLRELGYTDIWSAEVDGADGFTPLALAAAWEPTLNLGVAITPSYTRGPALLAQSVAAMADAAPGRFACGLGASSQVIVANWNGLAFEDQYRRVRDTLRFLKLAFKGEKVTEEFDTFRVKGFRLALIPEQLPPIYLAALRPGMLHLAGREADGAILNWLSAEDVATSVAEVHKAADGSPRQIVARIFVIVTEDATLARTIGRRMITTYLNVEAYAEFQRWLGRGPALQPMWDAWAAGDRKGALDGDPRRSGRPAGRPRISRRVPGPRAALCRQRRHDPRTRPHPDRRRPGRGGGRPLASRGIGRRARKGRGKAPVAEIDFRTTSVAELTRSVRAKEVSARELTHAALARIERLNPIYNAFVATDGDRALGDADAIDARIAEGGDPGPLAGIPIGVKDLQNARGYVTTYGSALHADDPPATTDDPFVARMRAAGCVILGKTNTPEFGWMGNTSNAIFGASYNPFDTSRGPGGSSGGSSAAIAAGMVPLATGSDGGGSIRIPSACCGLSGMKPSLGRVPAGGPNPPGWIDLSTNGPMARRIADVTQALDVAVGPDPTDLRALPRPEANWVAALDDPHVPVSIAYSPTLGYATVDAEVAAACERAVEVLASLGADVVVVDSVFDDDPVGDFLTLTAAATLRTLRPYMDHPRWDEVDPVLRHFVNVAQSTTAEQILQVFDRFHLHEPEVGRLVPSLTDPRHADLRRPRPARRRDHQHGQRRDDRQLGPLHLPVQHDPLPRRHCLRRHERDWPAHRAAAGRAPAR